MYFTQSRANCFVAGHRGCAAACPENTLVSFQKALELGVDCLELDLHLSADGELAVIHDAVLERTTDSSGPVADRTMAQLKTLDAGRWFAPDFEGVRIPCFEELLELVRGTTVVLNVEIKNRSRVTVDRAVEALRAYGMEERYVIASFDAGISAYAHTKHMAKTQGFPSSYVHNHKSDTYLHYYSVGIEMKDLCRALCDEFRAMGIDPWAYCPDTDEEVLKAVDSGASLLTCNNPEPALRILKEKGLRRTDV